MAPQTNEKRSFSTAELTKLVNKANLHLLIHGKVYDLHEFVNEHPGGDLVLLGEAGKDATEPFETVQHSDEARELMEEYLVGYCDENNSSIDAPAPLATKQGSLESRHFVSFVLSIFVSLALGLYWSQML